MKYLPTFLCFMFSIQVFSQASIKGKVVIEESDTPIAGASVFINSTSNGTVSDNNGNFELYNIPHGKYELIISSVGYETIVYPFVYTQLPIQLKLMMKIKVKELKGVEVGGYEIQTWEQWGKYFLENFIGYTANPADCKIKNTGVIQFRYYKKQNKLIAIADKPLIIENKALGYKLKYQLEEFEINFKENSTLFLGYPFFEELESNRNARERKWASKRLQAYNGSMLHFMRSLNENRLKDEGFEVQRLRKELNTEKLRIKALYKANFTRQVDSNTNNRITIQIGSNGSILKDSARIILSAADSIAYYERILQQKDYLDIFARQLLTSDSLITIDSEGNKLLGFPDYLHIVFNKEIEDVGYLKFVAENRNPYFQQSTIFINGENQLIHIDSKGNYSPPQLVFSTGYWAWSEKIANMLPLDYEKNPEPKKVDKQLKPIKPARFSKKKKT